MARTPRNQTVEPDKLYHVIARGNERMTIFRSAQDYAKYLEILLTAKRSAGILIHHFVLMPNHIHLLTKTGKLGLSRCMHLLQNAYSKYYRKKYGNFGHVWQGRFKNVPIESDAHLLACGNYIELNPVRAGLVNDPAHWPSTSYRAYALGETSPLVDLDQLYLDLDEDPSKRQAIYRKLLTQTRQA